MSKRFYQKRKVIYHKITNWLTFLLLFIGTFLLLVSAILNIIILHNIGDNSVLYYCGNYNVTEKHLPRNTTYVFTLENGDVFSVPSELLRDFDVLKERPVLAFTYTGPRHIYRYGIIGGYTGVSITTADGSASFLDSYDTEKDVRGGAFVFSIVAIACLSLLVFIFWLSDLGNKV